MWGAGGPCGSYGGTQKKVVFSCLEFIFSHDTWKVCYCVWRHCVHADRRRGCGPQPVQKRALCQGTNDLPFYLELKENIILVFISGTRCFVSSLCSSGPTSSDCRHPLCQCHRRVEHILLVRSLSDMSFQVVKGRFSRGFLFFFLPSTHFLVIY